MVKILSGRKAVLCYCLAGVADATSLGGLCLPEVYAKETPSWGSRIFRQRRLKRPRNG